jgi:hypothetical protein
MSIMASGSVHILDPKYRSIGDETGTICGKIGRPVPDLVDTFRTILDNEFNAVPLDRRDRATCKTCAGQARFMRL